MSERELVGESQDMEAVVAATQGSADAGVEAPGSEVPAGTLV